MRRNRQNTRSRSITCNVGDVVVRGANPRQVVERLEQLAREAQTDIAREMFLQHAEHYRKEI